MPTGEVSTKSIVTDALRQGKEVYVPYISRTVTSSSEIPASVMDMVGLHSQEDFEKLEPDSWGIPTPSESSLGGRKLCLAKYSNVNRDTKARGEEMQSLDMIVMPGVAFDRGFARLGHGKGYYDFFLSQYQQGMGDSSSSESKMPFLGMCDQEGSRPSDFANVSTQVGLALKEQLLPEGQEVPMGSSDWSLDALIVGDNSVLRR